MDLLPARYIRPHSPHRYIDRGGTFTDIVTFYADGSTAVQKVPSDKAVIGDESHGTLTFGTTVATNALLERTGVRTLLLVSEGFADLVHIGDGSRPALFDPDAYRLPPLCTAVREIGGRVDVKGRELQPVVIPPLPLDQVQSVAVVLLHSDVDPAHELAVRRALRERAPHLHIALGHQFSATPGYLARIQTALVDAAITPLLLDSFDKDNIPRHAMAMRSDGSVCPAADLRAPQAVLSGPAGGVLAVQEVARLAGFRSAVGLDMGGTSTDVCRLDVGRLPRREGDIEVAGVQLRQTMLEVHTIAAGGGSVLRSDGRELTVGPDSAGADPGPQCYGKGGPPTLTDAALAMGLIDPTAFEPPLDPSQIQLPDEAVAFLNVARESMALAVRTLATHRGVDLHDHALVAYGGAAGQHAAKVAEILGMRTVLVHPYAAVLSAWGQSLASEQQRRERTVWRTLPSVFADLPRMIRALIDTLPSRPNGATATLAMRTVGTDHSIWVTWHDGATIRALTHTFAEEHRRRYGIAPISGDLQVERIEVLIERGPPPRPTIYADPWGLGSDVVTGPTVLYAATTAIAVPVGWRALRRRGLLVLEHVDAAARAEPHQRTAQGVALWSHRFMAVAQQAGAVLRRLARSVNIRERLDYSCAIFDCSGALVANAPHIPVHLGAMGETVRDLLHSGLDLPPGQSWLCNDPAAGGSHLPDLTVITAVHHQDRRFFVACRGHHVDVGGTTPGSMPPRSTTLRDEGLVFRRVPLLHRGAMRDLRPLLAEARVPDVVIADLTAQVAANHRAASALRDLGPAKLIETWMAHLQDVAAESVDSALKHLRSGSAHDQIDGVTLALTLRREQGTLVLDWSGTTGPHPGNLNAPAAVVRAATLYSLRILVDRNVPLNDGAMRNVRTIIPHSCALDPSPTAAVAGGNVETSQRLVDLLLVAADRMAASAGSMSNLTLGGDGWAFYETIPGGSGASATHAGASARQAHMTNTRATDPEILERRCPLRAIQSKLRVGSGGDGQRRGGDGMIRELEVLGSCTASLLAAWRRAGAPGAHGGGDATPGHAALRRGGQWQEWDGRSVTLQAGDRVRISTPGGAGWGAPTTNTI